MDKEHGINAFNQEFKQFEQVEKNQRYHLSEHTDDEEFDTDFEIKTCDMADFYSKDPKRVEKFAQDLGQAFSEIGFAILINHGVDFDLYQNTISKVIDFFEKTTIEQRMKYLAKRQGSVNQGYFPIKETTIIHPDLVEGWVFCRRAFNMENRPDFNESDFWPLPGYEPFFRTVAQEHEKLILPVMQSILRYFKADPHSFDKKLTKTNFGFRLNYYPPLQYSHDRNIGGRMLGHEDVDMFTILPAQNIDGLQVLNRRNMKWIHLDAPKNSIILNTGDYMQRITNNIFPSTTHRVSRPLKKEDYGKTRITFPMAVYLWEDEILDVLPNTGKALYDPIRAEVFHTRITSKYYGEGYAVG
ncbi:MAG: isopenicillin N synthase family oxygenase [Calditrichaeota bacterium]|nr:isopenicillin N synthase family oxygenase [Calditrichota bacterium]